MRGRRRRLRSFPPPGLYVVRLWPARAKRLREVASKDLLVKELEPASAPKVVPDSEEEEEEE